MRTFHYLAPLALILAPLLASAQNSQDVIVIPWPAKPPCDARDRLPKGSLLGFSERHGEPSFARRYAPSLTLPASEDKVFKIAKSNHFRIYLDGDGIDALCIEPPEGLPVNDESIRKVYMLVDDDPGRSRTTQIRYFVYADGNGMVTYIEPKYVYTAL